MKQKTYGYAVEAKSVYLVGSKEGYFKIGVSSDPEQRIKTLQSGMPFTLELIKTARLAQSQHAFLIEDALQAFCHKQRARGDWFKDIDVKAVIKRMTSEAEYYNA